MRLGFYYQISAVQEADGIRMPGYFGRFLDSLAQNCEHLTIFLHRPDKWEEVQTDYQLQSTNVCLVLLPSKRSFPHQLLYAGKSTMVISDYIGSLDAFIIRGPTPLMPAIARLCKKIPTILMLVGDQLSGLNASCQPAWRKELIRLYWQYIYGGIHKAARKSLVFVNSHELFLTYERIAERLIEIRTTTLTQEDFFQREDTCQSTPIRLLYTGRIDLEKGLLDMVEALSILQIEGEDVILDLAGWSKDVQSNMQKIMTAAQEGGVEDRVYYHGYKAIGPELFSFYRQADIFIIASQCSFEGFPRVIWEAMANSLPVVATRVGSIPNYIEGNAELAEPRQPAQLAQAVSRLIHDPGLRKQNISQGYKVALQNTLEEQTAKMIPFMEEWVRDWSSN